MNPIPITCPHCNHHMEYWTQNDTVYCTSCKESIPVEPCTEKLEVDTPAEEGEDDTVI